MQNLLRLLLKYNFQITFVILEVIALSLVLRVNPLPNSRSFQLFEGFHAAIYGTVNRLGSFAGIRGENDRLIFENARLKYRLDQYEDPSKVTSMPAARVDSLDYDLIAARVINHSVNKAFNYLTLNKGSQHGVKADMAVIGPDGIAGVVRNVSARYCTVVSVLNPEFRASVKMLRSDFFGSLQWNGGSYQKAMLVEIPSHAPVNQGDTVVTSGFSAIFPEGEMVGTVETIDLTPSGSFYNIRLSLSQDMKKLNHVYIVRHFHQQEVKTLEQLTDE